MVVLFDGTGLIPGGYQFSLGSAGIFAPLRYTEEPLLSGYVSSGNRKMLPGRPAILVGRIGSGRVIMNTDNPNFRAFWFGTNRLFINSIYFGRTISRDATIN